MMKKEYNEPIVEIITFDADDIITTSTNNVFDSQGLLDKQADKWF